MKLADWLMTRHPSPPEHLLERMRAELRNNGSLDSEVSARILADAGASILADLDRTGCGDRAAAFDLLAADALFTYAFEAAAESTGQIQETARYTLDRVAGT